MNNRITTLIIALFMLLKVSVFAGEGMWLPLFLKSLNEKEMKSMGMKMSAEDIYNVNKGSLKDAIVHFGGFCTSEIISPDGLLLTNHHCGYSQIQRHSTVENNLLKEGFWADDRSKELSCQGLSATFIVSIEDVTEQILGNISGDLRGKDRQSAIDHNIAILKNEFQRINYKNLEIKPFYKGNQFFAIETVTYPDVRLVGNPPESIGKFGSDTDNWIWPRHTGDFALFRIYADKDNNPTEYNPDNQPYSPKHYLPISIDGVDEGDFTMIFGFPGRTNEYVPATAVDQTANVFNPAKIAMRDAALKTMDKYMREDESIRLQYASKYARIANYWKKWMGESQGLEKTNAIGKKKDYEAIFEKKVNGKKKYRAKYAGLLSDVKDAYLAQQDYKLGVQLTTELLRQNVEIFQICQQFSLMKGSLENHGETEFLTFKEKITPRFEGFYGSYRQNIDKEVLGGQIDVYKEYMPPQLIWPEFNQLLEKYGSGAGVAEYLHAASKITSQNKVTALLALSPEKFIMALVNDPLMNFYNGMQKFHRENINPEYQELQVNINDLQREYMKAQMEVFGKKKRFYPDANSTLRVTYGKAEGYQTEEAGQYKHITYLDGVIDKYIPGDYEFDVHPKLIDLYEKKDYGQYATIDGKMPVCFIGSNHTTGGNSGSPVIDAHGNLIGLNFDRVWEGTMSDLNYDRSICRNIMVDIRYVLFVVDKFAGATHLIDEMTLVRPKSGK
jgi:hypothetical protein